MFTRNKIAIALISLCYFWNNRCSFTVAQSIIPDQTLPANERSQIFPVFPSEDLITGGAIRGRNLFHSFEQFNIAPGKGIYFLDPGRIQNIFSRVTGSNRSEIFGTLGTIQIVNGSFALTNANLFLINPNGILFGAGSRLNLAGSFIATTAPAIQFGNQGSFSAINPTVPDVLTVNPSAFLFNRIAAQPIIVRSSSSDFTKPEELAILGVAPNRDLLLVGGEVRIEGGLLRANRSQIELGGLAGSGTIGLVSDNTRFNLNFTPDSLRANVALTQSASVSATGQAGSISIQAHNLEILDGSILATGISDGIGKAGDLTIQVSDRISINNAFLNTGVLGGGEGQSGNLNIAARTLNLNNARVSASSFGQGEAGNVELKVTDAISAKNSTVAATFSEEQGRGGDVTVEASSLLLDRSNFNTGTFGRGDAGRIAIRTSGEVSLTNQSQISSNVIRLPQFGFVGIGNSGTIQIDASKLSLDEDSTISTLTFGQGNAGEIRIRAADAIRIDGSSIFSDVGLGAIGKGGNTQIQAQSISLLNGARLATATFGQGNAGNLSVKATDSIQVSGNSLISSAVQDTGIGKAGEVTLQARSIALSNRAKLVTGTLGQGDSGNLLIQADDSFQLSGDSLISSSVQAGGIGQAGDISIQTRSLSLTEGSQIQSAIFRSINGLPAGRGQGGTVKVNASDSILISGTNAEGFPSALTTTAELGSQGQAGNLFITTPNLQIRDRATISAETRNADPGGNIVLKVGNLSITDDAKIRTSATDLGNAGTIDINANSVQLQRGNIAANAAQSGGGSITLNAQDVRLRERSLINTNVAQGTSGGGDIVINANTVLALEDSDILANANQGRGGNITIRANAFIADFFSNNQSKPIRYTGDITPFRGNERVDISASSALGISGNVRIPDFSDLQNDLAQLPQALIDPSTLLSDSCIVRNRRTGNFTVTGSGGLSARPGEAAIATFSTGEVRSIQPVGDRIVEPQGIYRLPNGQLVLSRDCL